MSRIEVQLSGLASWSGRVHSSQQVALQEVEEWSYHHLKTLPVVTLHVQHCVHSSPFDQLCESLQRGEAQEAVRLLRSHIVEEHDEVHFIAAGNA